jgi:hypothetical protein
LMQDDQLQVARAKVIWMTCGCDGPIARIFEKNSPGRDAPALDEMLETVPLKERSCQRRLGQVPISRR